jgi:hypothetical protein
MKGMATCCSTCATHSIPDLYRWNTGLKKTPLKTKPLPFHPLILAVYPTLALLAYNIEEVDPRVALRPLVISLAGGMLLLGLLRWLLKDWQRAGLLASFLLVVFFSYGHVYSLLEETPLFGFNLGRHRYLAVIYVALLLVGTWVLLRRVKKFQAATQMLNWVSLVLLAMPLVQTSASLWQSAAQQRQTSAALSESSPALHPGEGPMPDIYYIILDGHTRSDTLLNDFGYDNTPFLDELRSLGFYVADCSRSNYSYTQGSITAPLNLDYVNNLRSELESLDLGDDIWILLKQSRARRMLEEIGYQTVAFDTTYEWSRLSDADVYLSLGSDSASLQSLSPFEAMLIKSTAGLILTDSQNQFIRSQFEGINFPYSYHVNAQRFILDQLPNLPNTAGPKFVFVHLMVPHVPFVFRADGSVWEDPSYYNGENGMPSDAALIDEGYINQIAFIDQAILGVLQEILAESTTPPVIFMHGDHGWIDQNRLQILNAIYLPEQDYAALYPSISPVNGFRVIFNAYFGSDYELLPDISYNAENQPAPETSSQCINP